MTARESTRIEAAGFRCLVSAMCKRAVLGRDYLTPVNRGLAALDLKTGWRGLRRLPRCGQKGEMSLLLQVICWTALTGTITSTIYCLMVIVAAMRFGVRKR